MRRKFILGQDSCRVPVVRQRASTNVRSWNKEEEEEGKTSTVGNVTILENGNFSRRTEWTIGDDRLDDFFKLISCHLLGKC